MPDGRIGHAELALGDNVVMLASVFPEMDQTTPERGRKTGWRPVQPGLLLCR